MKEIPNFPNYAVTKNGRIWSYISNKWLRPLKRNKTGHLFVKFYKNGIVYQILVHRLVLETYVGKCPKSMESRHLNGNPKDNRLKNLCWDTHSENMLDKFRHGNNPPNSKLTGEQAKLIFNAYHDGAYEIKELAEYFGVVYDTIRQIVCKKTWKKYLEI